MPNLSETLKKLKEVEPVRLIVSSFFLIIVVGTILLMLPISSRGGKMTAMVDALFTATSATCVTGLVVFDTWTHWSTFGHVVILALIQVGGLGFVTLATGFNLLLRRKLGLRDLLLARESASGNSMDVSYLIKMILKFTVACEAVGAVILMFRFVPQFGAYGIWISVFESVSAYCNAGFDILGFVEPDASLMNYVDDPLVCLTISFLIILGGIGFVVVDDVLYSQILPRIKKQKRRRLNFHSTTVLISTGFLLVLGTILYFCCEYDNTMKDMHFLTRLNASFFQSASARTAGFASIDIAAEHDFTKIITIVLMFIGASPASTGGGIKTTTFVVLAAAVCSVMSGRTDAVFRRRRIEQATVYRALAIFTAALLVLLITTGVILSTNSVPISGVDALFEAASAFGTVGLTAGVTPVLSVPSKLIVSLTMFIGRVGPVSLALALSLRHRDVGAVLPEGKLIVG